MTTTQTPTARQRQSLARKADKLADRAQKLQWKQGATERVEQMFADARSLRAQA